MAQGLGHEDRTPSGNEARYRRRSTPYGGLTWDAAGNLYGATFNGGKYVGGIVFELSPATGGGWTETILHTFASGQNPSGRVIIDAAGNLYGATINGGDFKKGIVYELSPVPGGGWVYKRLHAFGNGKDGAYPNGGLTMDAFGNIYGSTGAGGVFDGGTIFELVPSAGGVWARKLLVQFNPNAPGGGYDPNGDLAIDVVGALYGTTMWGGSNPGFGGNGCGTVFKLTPAEGGLWTRSTIHEFGSGTDGVEPYTGVILDGAGNLYGTTIIGGVYYEGTAYKLTHTASGWTQKVLHNFSNNGRDGENPLTLLQMDSTGNLYGVTSNGGDNQLGTVFKLTSAATGAWPETILHRFDYSTFTDGFYPDGPLIFDASGNLYGTTTKGGANDVGTVFEITP